MQLIFDYLNANPWLYAILVAGVIVWTASIWVIFASPKFLRKWLWLLLAFVSFTWSWEASPGFTLSIGLPLGSLYVLWFWRFGRSPTEEEIARHGPKLAAPGPSAANWKVVCVRLAYALAAVSSAVMGVWAGSGTAVTVLLSPVGGIGNLPPDFALIFGAMKYFQAAFAIALSGLFAFLVFRPYGWGKLIALFCGIGWLGFCGAMMILSGDFDGRCLPLLAAAIGMIAACVLHHSADPRITGPYLRQS